jgi:putative transposase
VSPADGTKDSNLRPYRVLSKTRRPRLSHDSRANRRLEDAADRGQSGPGLMLPAPVQFIITMIAYAINQRMARRVDYLREEVRVLKEALATATGKTRIDFSPEQRRRLALKGKDLTAKERRACCQVVRPATILAWFRQLAAQKYDGSKARTARRPRKPGDVRSLVLHLARDNPGWGYTKIRDTLRGLKIEIGRTTVATLLAQAGIEPAPDRIGKRTWKHFLKSHWAKLYACDFFSVEVLGVFGTVRHLVFFVMEVKSRAVQIAGIHIAPNGDWMKQIARNLLDPVDGVLRDASYLIHDRDPLFTAAWTAMLEAHGVKCVPIPAHSPNCNSHAERFVKTVRTECLDHFVIFGQRHLRYLAQGVHGALPLLALPPRHRQPDHPTNGITGQRQRAGRRRPMPIAPRRSSQLLLPHCCVTSGGEFPDITGS